MSDMKENKRMEGRERGRKERKKRTGETWPNCN